MYAWRQLSEKARQEVLEWRKTQKRPWHSPPHWKNDRTDRYLFTASCFEHSPVIGFSAERLGKFEESLLQTLSEHIDQIYAWVVLPNHYHALVSTKDPLTVLLLLGRLHGRTSFHWNGEENTRGRQVWVSAAETAMKSERHFWATMNYIHHNPVKHGWANTWKEWPFSSANQFLEASGRPEAERIWKEFPIGDYGKGWDD
jgi:putative transposase